MGSELYRSIQKMWELSQIRILQTNFKIGILHTFRKFFFSHLLTLNSLCRAIRLKLFLNTFKNNVDKI
ncbi:conserved hypothetical protein [Leptospira interrogans serovar Copenhageni str. Fiocruz L1-130]|uniref:Uncharacterized protein n=1 Tax=Leptospira interrogans serogroup Icterohaemorrhagiae serovar copenhageni (strain Fiocruz L1-130) TaxID=267671 RepID=Q72UK7_LEPIC|nr:conserved hypothetical protein [Leptospira interrogans serovar Copenhageni str. Fiocruz L1-130]